MTEVQNRKMFRRKDARNKLRQLGGIMTSSPDLMQSVQKFSRGGIARAQQQLQNQLPNLLAGSPTMGIDPRAALIAQEDALRAAPFGGTISPELDRALSMPRTGTGVADRDLGDTDEAVALTEPSIPDPPVITETSLLVEPVETGKDIVDYAKLLKDSKASSKEVQDKIFEMLAVKKPGEKLSLEDRFKKMQEVRKNVLGDNKEAEKSIDGFNLAMLGFAIASGDSPNALTNIAKGALAGAQQMQATAERRRARAERIQEADFQQAVQDERLAEQYEREERRFREGKALTWATTVYSDARQDERFIQQAAITQAQLKTKLAQEIRIANTKEINEERRFKAEQNTKLLTSVIKGLESGEVASIASASLLGKGIKPNDPNYFSSLVTEIEGLVQNPNVIKALKIGQKGKSLDPGKERGAYIADAIAKLSAKDIREIASQFDKETMTQDELIKYFGDAYDKAQGNVPTLQAAPGAETVLNPDDFTVVE
tara:strand:+ start:1716 stop:3170 length:1455 start_codon:yes stop_codon:yes gene_type:complete